MAEDEFLPWTLLDILVTTVPVLTAIHLCSVSYKNHVFWISTDVIIFETIQTWLG